MNPTILSDVLAPPQHIPLGGQESGNSSRRIDPVLTACNLPPVLVTSNDDLIPIAEVSQPQFLKGEVPLRPKSLSKTQVSRHNPKTRKTESSQHTVQFLIADNAQFSRHNNSNNLSANNIKFNSQSSQSLIILKTAQVTQGSQIVNGSTRNMLLLNPSSQHGTKLVHKANSQYRLLLMNTEGSQTVINKTSKQQSSKLLKIEPSQPIPPLVSAERLQKCAQLLNPENQHCSQQFLIEDTPRFDPQLLNEESTKRHPQHLNTDKIQRGPQLLNTKAFQNDSILLNTEVSQRDPQLHQVDGLPQLQNPEKGLPSDSCFLNTERQYSSHSLTVQNLQNDLNLLTADVSQCGAKLDLNSVPLYSKTENLRPTLQVLNRENAINSEQLLQTEDLQYNSQILNVEGTHSSPQLVNTEISQNCLQPLVTENSQTGQNSLAISQLGNSQFLDVNNLQCLPQYVNHKDSQSGLQSLAEEIPQCAAQPLITEYSSQSKHFSDIEVLQNHPLSLDVENPQLRPGTIDAEKSNSSTELLNAENLQQNQNNLEILQRNPQPLPIQSAQNDLQPLKTENLPSISHLQNTETVHRNFQTPKVLNSQSKQRSQNVESSQQSPPSAKSDDSRHSAQRQTTKIPPEDLEPEKVETSRNGSQQENAVSSQGGSKLLEVESSQRGTQVINVEKSCDSRSKNSKDCQSNTLQSSEDDSQPVKPKKARLCKNADASENDARPPKTKGPNMEFLNRERRSAFLNALISIQDRIALRNARQNAVENDSPKGNKKGSPNRDSGSTQQQPELNLKSDSQNFKEVSRSEPQPANTDDAQHSPEPQNEDDFEPRTELSDSTDSGIYTNLPDKYVPDIDPQLLDVETSDVDTHILDTAVIGQDGEAMDIDEPETNSMQKQLRAVISNEENASQLYNPEITKVYNTNVSEDHTQLLNAEDLVQSTHSMVLDQNTRMIDTLVAETATELLKTHALGHYASNNNDTQINIAGSKLYAQFLNAPFAESNTHVISTDISKHKATPESKEFTEKDSEIITIEDSESTKQQVMEIIDLEEYQKKKALNTDASQSIVISDSSEDEDSCYGEGSMSSASYWSTDDEKPISSQCTNIRQSVDGPQNEISQQAGTSPQPGIHLPSTSIQVKPSSRGTSSSQRERSKEGADSLQLKKSHKSAAGRRQRKKSKQATSQPSLSPPLKELPPESADNTAIVNPSG